MNELMNYLGMRDTSLSCSLHAFTHLKAEKLFHVKK